jgi:hypothetical protein
MVLIVYCALFVILVNYEAQSVAFDDSGVKVC